MANGLLEVYGISRKMRFGIASSLFRRTWMWTDLDSTVHGKDCLPGNKGYELRV